MGVVFILLKWIGILLAVILVLLLFLCILVLYVPVRYCVYVCYEDDLKYRYRLNWCLRIVSLQKKEDSNCVRLLLFGIPIRTIAGEDEMKGMAEHKVKGGVEKAEEPLEKVDKVKKEKKEKKRERKNPEKSREKYRKNQKENESRKQSGKIKKSRFEKLRFHFRKISSIMKFIRDRENKKAVSMLWQELISLLQHISPKQVRGELFFGTGDPASTGLVLGGISLFPWAYQKSLRITPDFDKALLRGQLTVKGRIRVRYIAGLAWRMYHSRKLKRMIHKWKNI